MAQGRTFAELHALTGGFAWALAVALRDELRRGRLRLDGDRYTLAPDFPPDLLAALRALDRESLRSLAAANGWRPPLARETAGPVRAAGPLKNAPRRMRHTSGHTPPCEFAARQVHHKEAAMPIHTTNREQLEREHNGAIRREKQ